jgi:predicted small secreted protein
MPYHAADEKVGTAFALWLLKEPIAALFVRRTTVKILYLLTLIVVAIATSACNTTRGFGQDVEATGEAIEDTAEDAMDDDDNE